MFLWFRSWNIFCHGDECKESVEKFGNRGRYCRSTIDDVLPGAADLFVCSADLVPNAEKAGKAIGLNNMVSVKEIEEKLKTAFEEDQ